MKNTLNVFKYNNRNNKIKQFFCNIKYAYQRATKGYCDVDLYSLDMFYIEVIINTIDEFSKNLKGYPDKHFSSMEEWEYYLDTIKDYFIEYRDSVNSDSIDVIDNYPLKIGLELLFNRYDDLWD